MFFKYGTFLLENFTQLVNLFGADFHPAKPISSCRQVSRSIPSPRFVIRSICTRKSEPVKTCSTSLCSLRSFHTWWPARSCVRRNWYHSLKRNEASQQQMLQGFIADLAGLIYEVVWQTVCWRLRPIMYLAPGSPENTGCLDRRTGFFRTDILRLRRLFNLCHRGSFLFGFRVAAKFPLSLTQPSVSRISGEDGILPYRPGWDYLYIPLGGNGMENQNLYQFNDHHAAGRLMAWRQLDLRGMGCLAWSVFWGEKILQDFRKKPAMVPMTGVPSGEVGVGNHPEGIQEKHSEFHLRDDHLLSLSM